VAVAAASDPMHGLRSTCHQSTSPRLCKVSSACLQDRTLLGSGFGVMHKSRRTNEADAPRKHKQAIQVANLDNLFDLHLHQDPKSGLASRATVDKPSVCCRRSITMPSS